MKAYINKGTKIKWENSPSAPEFTDERIKAAVDTYFPVSSTEPAQADFLMWDEDHNIWGPHTPRIDDNTDVTTNNPEDGQILVYDTSEWNNITPVLNLADDVNITTPAEGDTLVYDATAGEWKNVAPATPPTWSALDTVTADGVEIDYTIELPANTTAIVIDLAIKQGSADDSIYITPAFGGSTFGTRIASIGTLISSAGDRWARVNCDGPGLWRTMYTNTATGLTSNVAYVTRNDNTILSESAMSYIKVSATTNPIPADSTIQIYALHN